MCSIFGVLDLKSDPVELRKKALELSRLMRHRGPDWSGVYASDKAILAHERLSIVDVNNGAQPLYNAAHTHVLAVNGEIYNHQALRQQLSDRYAFQTGSDCEVILALYQEKGPEFLDDLQGMFAFALYDTEKDAYLIGRDHLGIIPLYMGHDEHGNLYVASEMKALVPVCRTIKEFPAGSYLWSQDGQIREYYRRDWFDYDSVKDNVTDAAALRTALEESVKSHLMSDVPYGVLLSGGLDSSLIACLARPDVVFTCRYPYGPRYDEFEDAAGDRSDEKFILVPKLSYALSGAYTRAILGVPWLNRVDWSWKSETPYQQGELRYFRAQGVELEPLVNQPPTGNLNVRSALSFDFGLEVGFFGKNLTDEEKADAAQRQDLAAYCSALSQRRQAKRRTIMSTSFSSALRSGVCLSLAVGVISQSIALALGVTDRILMLEYSIYSVISPEGCAAILWRDAGEKRKAAAAFKPDAAHCLELGVVDGIIPEPDGGAHTNPDEAARLLGAAIADALDDRLGAAVADGEALAGHAALVVEHAGRRRPMRRERRAAWGPRTTT